MSESLLHRLTTTVTQAADAIRADPGFGAADSSVQSAVVGDALSSGLAQQSARSALLADQVSDLGAFPATAAREMLAADARLAAGADRR
ncbi:hypothetical protein [Cryobacterium zongtaii]|uniref:hypothetical protein n=1 Tax=Cryobacterium zongtaii TaxID=1259217 RepID=UPI000CD3B044|nr:hypothetical protein [Cryobacterium zongtaii]